MIPDHKTRKDAYFGLTLSICPQCRNVIQGKILLRDGRVILQKRCIKHGEFEALISSNIDYWQKAIALTKPGAYPKKFSNPISRGCPEDCGLCPDHEQHTCTPIIEINNRCDLKCPVCIVWNQNNYTMSFNEFKTIVDGLVEKEGNLEVCVLSGGEPTIHPEFFRLAEYAISRKEIERVMISSHGLKIARDDEFAKRFKDMGLHLSLQFDSLRRDRTEALRGEDLLDQKMKCLEKCAKYDIPTAFVITAARGYNQDELGTLLDYALSFDFTRSVTFQPMAYTGSGGTQFPQDQLNRLDHAELHSLLQTQTGWLKGDDFLPVPCSHPSCYTNTYVFKMSSGKYMPFKRFLRLKPYIKMLTNRGIIQASSSDPETIETAIYDLWANEMPIESRDVLLSDLKNVLNEFHKSGGLPSDALARSEKHVKVIYIHSFMDEYDFDLARIRKCCFHYCLPDGRTIPGCAYNSIHRFRDPRLALEGIVPPARQPLKPEKA